MRRRFSKGKWTDFIRWDVSVALLNDRNAFTVALAAIAGSPETQHRPFPSVFEPVTIHAANPSSQKHQAS